MIADNIEIGKKYFIPYGFEVLPATCVARDLNTFVFYIGWMRSYKTVHANSVIAEAAIKNKPWWRFW